MMKRSVLRPALLAGLILGSAVASSAQAATASTTPISAGARLAATCAACHGTAGATVGRNDGGSGPIPSLAGQSREALSSSLRAFKAGTRQATIMTQIAKGYTDEQIELLSAYFAAQKKGG